MEKLVYFEPMFSNRREKLIELCTKLQKEGKYFIYILPSREALSDVRFKLLDKLKGITNSKIIMFDEIERDITENYITRENVIYDHIQRLIMMEICIKHRDKLKYFNKICAKKGFIEESLAFIKNLKRKCISEEEFNNILEQISDEILQSKLYDLHLLYKGYNKFLKENNLYDINDISLLAVDKVKEYEALDSISTFIIDGFINIDIVNQKLIKEIAALDKANIYVSCPYVNSFNQEFLQEEIIKVFKAMDFEIETEAEDYYDTKDAFKKLSQNLFSGEQIKLESEDISIRKYPNITSEVRETAREIKNKIMCGVNPKDIAIFANSRDKYSAHLNSIFKEFGIPLYMNYEISLSDANISRDIILKLKSSEFNENKAEKWLQIAEEEINLKNEELNLLVSKAFNSDLLFEEKLVLKAFEAMKKLINDMKVNYSLCKALGKNFSKENFIEDYIQCLADSTITMEQGISGGVKVLNTDLAKGVFYKHIYVLGLNEGEVPGIVKNDGIFDEIEVVKLKEKGIRYEDYIWELTREKIRFNLTLSSAIEKIVLSYRSSDEDGKFLIPSSLLEEVKFLTSLQDTEVVTMRSRFNIPYSNVMSSYELTGMSLKNYFEKKYNDFEDENIKIQIEDLCEIENNIGSLIKKGSIEYHREKEKDFNEYEGNLGQLAVLKGLFSPSRINDYFNCPFKYMLRYIFELEEVNEEEEKLSNMTIGEIYHKALYCYYYGLEDFLSIDDHRLSEAFEKSWAEMEIEDLTAEEEEKYKEELKSALENFIICDLNRINKYEKETGNIIRPYLLEQFIKSDIFDEEIYAKVDRVDLEYTKEGKVTGRFIIYDYKKKNIDGIDAMLQKKNCQIAAYYYFVLDYLKKELGRESLDCIAVLYLSVELSNKSVKKDGLYRTEFKKALSFTGSSRFDMNKEIFYSFMQFLKELMLEAINNIKKGYFPYSLSCDCFDNNSFSNCYYKDMCRYSKNKISVIGRKQ